MTKAKLFSPNQVALISWLGTPGAAVLVLAKNFDVLGNRAAATRTMLWGGLLFFVWFFWVIPSSEGGIRGFIHIACINAAHQIATRHQMSSLAISLSKDFDFQSDEIVVSVIVGFLIALVVLFVVGDLALLPVLDECS